MGRSCGESQNGVKHHGYGPNPEGTTTLQTMKEYAMLNRYKKAAVIIALAGSTSLTGLAYAQDRSAPAGTAVTQSIQADQGARRGTPDNWLNLGQIYDKVVAAGYTDVREIERERDGYEAKARDTDGRSVKLYVEPVQGRILDERVRDRDRKHDRRDERGEERRDRRDR